MSNKIQEIQDKSGNTVFPLTHERAVRDSDGTTLESKLQDLQELVTLSDKAFFRLSYDYATNDYLISGTEKAQLDECLGIIKNGVLYPRIGYDEQVKNALVALVESDFRITAYYDWFGSVQYKGNGSLDACSVFVLTYAEGHIDGWHLFHIEI